METKELTNGIIKSIATDAIVNRSFVTDLDNCRQGGYYLSDGRTFSAGPLPISVLQGTVEVYERSGGCLQRFCHTNASVIYQRFFSSNSQSWSDWYKFAGTKVT